MTSLIDCLVPWLFQNVFYNNYHFFDNHVNIEISGMSCGIRIAVPAIRMYLNINYKLQTWWISSVTSWRLAVFNLKCVYTTGPLGSDNVFHVDVIRWRPFPRYWPFVREIHRPPVNFPHKGQQWRGALMFPLICAWIHGWVNNRETGDLRRHYDVIVMKAKFGYTRALMDESYKKHYCLFYFLLYCISFGVFSVSFVKLWNDSKSSYFVRVCYGRCWVN